MAIQQTTVVNPSPQNGGRMSRSTREATLTPAGTPSTPPRKTPHCKQCKRPRVGHPRSGCPFTDSSSPTTRKRNDAEPRVLTEKLKALNIGPSSLQVDEQEKRQRRRSSAAHTLVANPTLASISSEDIEAVGALLRPATLKTETEVDVTSRREPSVTPRKARTSAPAGLRSSSSAQKQDSPLEQKPPSGPQITHQRDIILDDMAKSSSTASVYSLDVALIPEMQQAMEKAGFSTYIITGGKDQQIGWMVLGRDEGVVKALSDAVKNDSRLKTLQTGRLAVAGGAGAVAGALAAWTGLALA